MSSTRHLDTLPVHPFQEFSRPAITLILFTILATQDLPKILVAAFWALIILIYILRLRLGPPPPSPKTTSTDPRTVARVLSILLLGGLFARSFQLHSFFPWPTGDESEALLISQLWSIDGWNGRFFHGFAQHPPAFHAMLAGWFSLFGVGLESMRSFQVVLSFVCLPLAFLAVRPFAGVRAALIATTFMTFGIWPLLISRFCLPVVPFIILFTVTWTLIGLHARENSASRRKRLAWTIGIAWSLGFLTYAIWPGIVVSFGLLAGTLTKGHPDRRGNRIRMFLGSLPGWILFGYAAWKEGFGGHIRDKILLSDPRALTESLHNISGYLRTLLTGIPGHSTDYGPLWGGLLNPMLAVLFLEGALLFILHRRHRLLGLGLFVLYLIPGILARGIEPFRILPAFLLALGLAAWGLDRFLSRVPPFRISPVVLTLILAISSVVDLVQLFGPYRNATIRWDPRVARARNIADHDVWKILKELSASDGPGRLLGNLRAKPADPALLLPVIRSEHPCKTDDDTHWIALVVDADYRQFLEIRWKDARFYRLREPLDGSPPLALIVLPSSKIVVHDLLELCYGNRVLNTLVYRQLLRADQSSNREDLDEMIALLARSGDPLLVSVLAEKALILAGAERRRLGSDPNDHLYRISYKILADALKRGYPATHLMFIRDRYDTQKKTRWHPANIGRAWPSRP